MLAAPRLRLHESRDFGASLIELMIGITIVAIGVSMAAPAFALWLRNSQIRSAAESLQNGIRFAQTEAVRRNVPVRFQVTSTLDASCALATTGANWIVNLGLSVNPAGSCVTAISDTNSPFILAASPTVTTQSTVTMTSTRPVVAFDGLGRQIPTTNPSSTVAIFRVQLTSSADSCVSAGGTARCLNVVVNPAGQIRVCDPSLSTTNTLNASVAC